MTDKRRENSQFVESELKGLRTREKSMGSGQWGVGVSGVGWRSGKKMKRFERAGSLQTDETRVEG
jgi:hypothetical protein